MKASDRGWNVKSKELFGCFDEIFISILFAVVKQFTAWVVLFLLSLCNPVSMLPCFNKCFNFLWVFDISRCLHSVLWCCWLGSRKGRHPACKKWVVVGCWYGYLSGVRCRLAYGPADATATRCLFLQKNLDWFYLSGTSLPGYSRTKAVKQVCVTFHVATLFDRLVTNVGGRLEALCPCHLWTDSEYAECNINHWWW